MLNRRSFSDVLPESPKSARKKEEARQAEFVRIGQVGCVLEPLCRACSRESHRNLQRLYVCTLVQERVTSPRLTAGTVSEISDEPAGKGPCRCE